MLLCLPGVEVSGSTGLLSLCCTQDKGHSTKSGKDSAKQHSNSRFFRAPGFYLLTTMFLVFLASPFSFILLSLPHPETCSLDLVSERKQACTHFPSASLQSASHLQPV